MKDLNLGEIEQESEALASKLYALDKQREELLALVKDNKKEVSGVPKDTGNTKLLRLEIEDLKS